MSFNMTISQLYCHNLMTMMMAKKVVVIWNWHMKVLKISYNITKVWIEIVSYFICGFDLTHLIIYIFTERYRGGVKLSPPSEQKQPNFPIPKKTNSNFIYRQWDSLIKWMYPNMSHISYTLELIWQMTFGFDGFKHPIKRVGRPCICAHIILFSVNFN